LIASLLIGDLSMKIEPRDSGGKMRLLLLNNVIIALLGGAIGRSVAPIKNNSASLRQFWHW